MATSAKQAQIGPIHTAIRAVHERAAAQGRRTARQEDAKKTRPARGLLRLRARKGGHGPKEGGISAEIARKAASRK